MSILALIIALVAIIVATLALVIQNRHIAKTAAQQEAWERAQQSHLRTWAIQQERHITDLETRFTAEFKEIHEARRKWGDNRRHTVRDVGTRLSGGSHKVALRARTGLHPAH